MTTANINRQFYIYVHRKPDGSPFYVGKGFGDRAYRFTQRNKHHQNVVAKYGIENITVEVFPCASEQIAFAYEVQTISALRAQGFNLVNYGNGGEGPSGIHRSSETRSKMALSKLGNEYGRANKGKPNGWSGRALSLEHKKKISSSLMGHDVTQQARLKMSVAKIGNKNRLGSSHA